MQEILIAQDLVKVFPISKKQQKIEKTNTPKKIAVNSLSFSLKKGETFGLLGNNGAGKTTTLRMLATLIKPNSGSITIDGVDAIQNPVQIRRKIGFLTSELRLEEFFTPNYMFDYFAKLHGVDPAVAKERKKSLFASMGIDAFAEVKIGDLSTGMKQKVSLAVSIVHDPDIIIFDEPTNGLDIIAAKVVTDFLHKLKETGKTVIISSHIFSLIEKTCDRVGILVEGKMAFIGEMKDILENTDLETKFFEVYGQLQGGSENA